MRKLGPQANQMYMIPDTPEKVEANGEECLRGMQRIRRYLHIRGKEVKFTGDLNKLGGLSK